MLQKVGPAGSSELVSGYLYKTAAIRLAVILLFLLNFYLLVLKLLPILYLMI